MATATSISMYAAASERVVLQLALSNVAVAAWPSDKGHDKRDKTIRNLAAHAVPGHVINPARLRNLLWISSGTQLARNAIAQSCSLAYDLLKPLMSQPVLQEYQAEVAAHIRSGTSGLPPLLYTKLGDPIRQMFESDVFLLEVFAPFLKRRGPFAPALPSRYVWNDMGGLRPGWGGFLRELGRYVGYIALLQLAADEHQRNGYHTFADRNKLVELWAPHIDRMLHNWLEDAVANDTIPAEEVRSTFDGFSKRFVYVPR